MPDDRLWNIYAGLDFLTPGARETLDVVSALVPASSTARVLDVACGKGAGAMLLADRHACRVLGIDVHPFAGQLARRARERGLGDRVTFVIGDGGRLPVRGAVFDVAMCIGAPSIVGTERCIDEMARVLRPGGALVVSDWVWARKPVPREAIPLGYDIEPLTLDEYVDVVRRAGLDVLSADPLPQSASDAYYEPLRARVTAMRNERRSGVPQPIEDELRIYDSGLGTQWWRYAVFVGRKP
ncbi:MAG: class I SAM-dependent methyltransferase [Dehalococcoidia bacterium]|nr:MAG: class I SAM-dependent methyltransferase [Dehalococcoidia bacterium]